MSKRFPGMRFSVRRLLIAMFVAVAVAVGAVVAIAYQFQSLKPLNTPWTGGYVDVTETPTFEIETATGSGQRNPVLSFIVSNDGDCEATWGGYYTLDEAEDTLDLDRRIAQIHRSGRTPVLSFGGRDNEDLIQACDSASASAAAMWAAVSRYDINTIDMDVEGDTLASPEDRTERAKAVKELVDMAAEEGTELAVWLTLPADVNGLTNDGLTTVDSFLKADVTLSGVNLMTMNFGIPSTERSMAAMSEEALESAHSQFTRVLLANGTLVTPQQVWTMLGATPMIGQNDEADEVFTKQDAVDLHSFAQNKTLGRLSFWSLNRDRSCDSNYADLGTAVNFCSGVNQEPLEFDGILSSQREGTAHQIPERDLSDEEVQPQSLQSGGVDDPGTSPYPVWKATSTYAAGDKVVWRHNVYTARWTNRGNAPDEVDENGQSAWRLVGPVLEGEEPRPSPTLPEGTYADWSPEAIYNSGDRVMFDGRGYEAKWWTQGDSPAASADTEASPWRILTDEEVEEAGGATTG